MKIAPSILSCDFSRLADEIQTVESGGADWIPVDVMDGHFVPNITIGPIITAGARKATDLPLEARLGAAYTGLTDLLITVEAQHARNGDFTFHLGGEYRAGERLRLRPGYQHAENRNLSAGLGLVTGRWIIDYAYVPFSSGLGDAHRITLLLESPSL